MERILGLDLGTNSIGWAIVDHEDDNYKIIDKGVSIFQDGVAHDKSGEKPAVAQRTSARALRRIYRRRRLRKIELLKVLTQNDLCPYLSEEQLHAWQADKKYPLDEAFLAWQRTDDNLDRNPYHDRYRALTEELNMQSKADRYALGRALYHMAQRRGFLSNRKESTKESDGAVKAGIKSLREAMQQDGCRYLGEYFYKLYQRGEKIRGRYTSRNEHYKAEFEAICSRQQLSGDLTATLRKAIFFQRPLKSQKGLVGHCTFEKDKSRCPVSHPRFEEFRMLQFINNIRITTPYEANSRPLNKEERAAAEAIFMRKRSKSKPHFPFDDIAKRLAGRKESYAYEGDKSEAPYRFNYRLSTSVAGCPVTAALKGIFGEDYINEICSFYTRAEGKTPDQIINDIWHALFTFDDNDKLREWAKSRLQLSDDDADKFVDIGMPQGYAALSINAIDKMLPFMRMGYRYDEAVFCANLKEVIRDEIWGDEQQRQRIVDDIVKIVTEHKPNPYKKNDTKENRICEYLREHGIAADLSRLYHPSMIEAYKRANPDGDGLLQLASPRTSSVRNPMAMRALFRLRILLNRLLREGKIDRDTKIRIEFSRQLNDANKRKAIERFQRDNEKMRNGYADSIRQLYLEQTGRQAEPSEEELLKYQLWEEQNHICLYTGRTIAVEQFIGAASEFDIEHTLPRARGGDNSQMNKTLCDSRFNRETKRSKLPTELAVHGEIMSRIESLGWHKKIEELRRKIELASMKAKQASTKEDKDKNIQDRHYSSMQLDYWQGKVERFAMTEVPEGFSNRQGVDIGIIGRYARLYMKTVFDHIRTVKGATTAEFRKMWGLQQEYEKKCRNNHVHHCIDAVTIACIGHTEYDKWAQYAADEERYRRQEGSKPHFDKPWPTFTEDVKAMAEELLIAHHTPDNMPKQSRKCLRIRGKVQRNAAGEIKYVQGDTARGVLHRDTFYGAIKLPGEEKVRYVIRKRLADLEQADIAKIVDEAVRQKVREAVERLGFQKAMSGKIYMNEEKGIPINKVRIFAPSITSPIHLKAHRDLSKDEHKRKYHVVNDSNYCMAIYEGADARGKIKRGFKIVNNLDAAKFFNGKTDRFDIVDQSDGNDYPLKWILKTGTMVLFYENSPEELYECSKRELTKRLYKIKAIANEGRIVFIYHQEARDDKSVTKECGNGLSQFDTSNPPAKLRLSVSKINVMVEGYDFDLSVTGEIIFKH